MEVPGNGDSHSRSRNTYLIKQCRKKEFKLPDQDTTFLVEIKTCKDTLPDEQLEACHKQHATYAQLHRTRTQIIPILIGASGTIYKTHTMDSLEKLGLEPDRAKKCAQQLHHKANDHLHRIVCLRRQLEPKLKHHTRPRPPTLSGSRGKWSG